MRLPWSCGAAYRQKSIIDNIQTSAASNVNLSIKHGRPPPADVSSGAKGGHVGDAFACLQKETFDVEATFEGRRHRAVGTSPH